MRVDLYTRCWNEADLLGFFFRHYDPFVHRYVVFDDGSTDGSLAMLRAHPRVDVRQMPEYSDPDSRVASGLAVLESCWQESRGHADWVIVTDIDEHLRHADLARYLAHCRAEGVTIVPALGFQMVSDRFPPADCVLSEWLTMGAPWSVMNKMNIFDPDAIDAPRYSPGRHDAAPVGRVVAPARDELLLLHYKYLGFERTRRRYEQALSRQRRRDLEMNWGFQYAWSADQLLDAWNNTAAACIDVAGVASSPGTLHDTPRWWDRYRRVPDESAARADQE